MDKSATSTEQRVPAKSLYHPGVLAAYCVLNLAVGLCLYGLNIYRRGGRVTGGALSVLAGMIYLLLVASAWSEQPGRNVGSLMMLGIVIALGILKAEDGPYRKAIGSGAPRAKWWPPLLAVVGLTVLVGLAINLARASMG